MVLRRTQLIVCGTLLAIGLSSSPAFAVSDEERAGARAAANQGADAFDQGKWQASIELFSRAEALVHSPIHLSYIARAQLKLGHWVEAYELFNRIKRDPLPTPVSPAVASAVADASHELFVLDAQMPNVIVNVKGGESKGVTVSMDGVEVPSALLGVLHPINPGTHKFRASSASESSSELTMDFKPGVRQTVDLVLTPTVAAPAVVAPVVVASAVPMTSALTPPPQEAPAAPTSDEGSPGSGMKIGGYVALGVGVVGVGLGTVFLIAANNKQKQGDDAFQACGGKACPVADRGTVNGFDSDAASGKTLALTSFIVGGAGLATGITLLVLGSKNKSPETAAHVEPFVGYRSLGLSGCF